MTYNRKELLRQSLTAILNQEEYGADIIIIDNASSDGTADMVSKEFNLPQIIYRNTGTNLGGAGGFQYGVKRIWRGQRLTPGCSCPLCPRRSGIFGEPLCSRPC